MSGYLESTQSTQTTLDFVESGGAPDSVILRLVHFVQALVKALTSSTDEVWVLQVSSRGSTWRKFLLSKVLRFRSIPYVVHLHSGGYPAFYSAQPPFLQRRIRSLFNRAALVAVLGEGWGRYVQDALGVSTIKTVQMPNAVPGPVRLGQRPLPVRVLFAGRVGKRKGAHVLLDAWSRLETDGVATLILAGDMDDPDGLIATALDSAKNVTVTGWLGSAALVEQMEHAHVLVLPSQAENLPLSLLEGMAWELAPVVTPVGAVPEVIRDGQDGLLVPVGDVQALAEALELVIKDHETRQRMATSARKVWRGRYALDSYRERFDRMVDHARERHRTTAKPRRRMETGRSSEHLPAEGDA